MISLGWLIYPLQGRAIDSLLQSPVHRKSTIPKIAKPIMQPEFVSNSLIDKDGATNGFRAYVGVLPQQKVGLVILTNRFIFNSGLFLNKSRGILFDIANLKP